MSRRPADLPASRSSGRVRSGAALAAALAAALVPVLPASALGGGAGNGSSDGCVTGPLLSSGSWNTSINEVDLHCVLRTDRSIDQMHQSGQYTYSEPSLGTPCPPGPSSGFYAYREYVRIAPGAASGPRLATWENPDVDDGDSSSEEIPAVDDSTPTAASGAALLDQLLNHRLVVDVREHYQTGHWGVLRMGATSPPTGVAGDPSLYAPGSSGCHGILWTRSRVHSVPQPIHENWSASTTAGIGGDWRTQVQRLVNTLRSYAIHTAPPQRFGVNVPVCSWLDAPPGAPVLSAGQAISKWVDVPGPVTADGRQLVIRLTIVIHADWLRWTYGNAVIDGTTGVFGSHASWDPTTGWSPGDCSNMFVFHQPVGAPGVVVTAQEGLTITATYQYWAGDAACPCAPTSLAPVATPVPGSPAHATLTWVDPGGPHPVVQFRAVPFA